jgi:hypothetical protein
MPEARPFGQTPSRHASPLDRLRVAEFARRLQEGEDEIAAAWSVLADPRIGIARWRGAPATHRPSDETIAGKLTALLRRALPELLERTRDVTVLRIASLSQKAIQVLEEVTAGEFRDAARARVQLDGARAILESGRLLRDRGGAPFVAVQVNQGGAPHGFADSALRRSPELRAAAQDLADRLAASRAAP